MRPAFTPGAAGLLMLEPLLRVVVVAGEERQQVRRGVAHLFGRCVAMQLLEDRARRHDFAQLTVRDSDLQRQVMIVACDQTLQLRVALLGLAEAVVDLAEPEVIARLTLCGRRP